MNMLRDYIKSLFLLELVKGLRLTGSYMFRKKFTVQYPEENAPVSPKIPRASRPASLRKR